MTVANSLFALGDRLENYVNTRVVPQSQYRSPFTPSGTSQFPITPSSAGSISVAAPQPKENLVTVNPSSDDGSRAAGLLAGQSGLVLAPLGRMGAGGMGNTALLGR